ncbi:SIR2 family NAD-dependent protein deacylase [Zunongwangia atlantica]|uniref:NAD-dependent protein deacylase n=1 Tax=Zunongwangia atlantica 22II14-10F7 TaxID=1185767 RepID=A0A1Y1T737_9FLAO|nr:NAD-dependent deacylase [Zunongwangia atlantica]ORL46375.1 NAD-dependent histone deacetylase [Zunongwangia atlantica 22II14-10F7]
MKNLVVLTGAGISAESGIKTFRDADGLWEGHDVMQVASPLGWEKDQELVLDFYNQRRKQLLSVDPNKAHIVLAELEQDFNVEIITQNIDDLHERAGSANVLHLHGELLKARSTFDENLVLDWKQDIKIGDFCEHNFQLRPHVVWFGEAVPKMEKAIQKVSQADIIAIIGTSMQVYPAAGLIDFASPQTPVYFIDPNPNIQENEYLNIYAEKAVSGVPKMAEELRKKFVS